MDRQTVPSSNLSSVGYDERTETLEIQFHNGSVFKYHDVPAETHGQLINARSVGSFFSTNIRNAFEHSKQS
ncbi:MAG: hypothetical protein K940chlam7_00565 [Chlamydiae bacterium]|nr:hypothetical protein [Chlamydiota bacterium]